MLIVTASFLDLVYLQSQIRISDVSAIPNSCFSCLKPNKPRVEILKAYLEFGMSSGVHEFVALVSYASGTQENMSLTLLWLFSGCVVFTMLHIPHPSDDRHILATEIRLLREEALNVVFRCGPLLCRLSFYSCCIVVFILPLLWIASLYTFPLLSYRGSHYTLFTLYPICIIELLCSLTMTHEHKYGIHTSLGTTEHVSDDIQVAF